MKLVPLLLAGVTLLGTSAPRSHRMTRVLILEETRSLGAGELGRYLADPDRGLRRRAALAAGRIGHRASVPRLIEMMNDSEAEIRQMAAFALGLIGDPAAVPRLLPALRDPEAIVRARAAQALGAIGDASAADGLVAMVHAATPAEAQTIAIRGDDPGSPSDPWIELRLGVFALADLGDARALEKALLRDGALPRFDWWAATYAAARKPTPALRPVLVEGARSNDHLSRIFAARGLGVLGGKDDLELLRTMVKDTEPAVALAAVRAIGAIEDPTVTATLTSGLASSDPALRQAALEQMAPSTLDPGLRDQFVANAAHTDPGVRGAALGALARLDLEQLALVLSGQDSDPAPEVRVALARALSDGSGDFAAGLLFGLLRDPSPAVVAQALESLRMVRTSDAEETLLQHLDSTEPAIRTAAVHGLLALRRVGLADRLEATYRAALVPPDLVTRAAVVRALAIDSNEAATESLRRIAATEPSVGLWREAAGALAAREAGPVPPFLPADRPFLDRRLAMAPFAPFPGEELYTPRVFLATSRGAVEIHLNVVEAPLACRAFSWRARRGAYNDRNVGRILPGVSVSFEGPAPGDAVPLREVGERPVGRGTVLVPSLEDASDVTSDRILITLLPSPELGRHATVLGWVASGMDVVDALRPGDRIETVHVWDGR